MSNSYFKQTLRLLKRNPVISFVGILGTALALCLVMLTYIGYRVEKDPIYPEVNRNRTLYLKSIRAEWKETEDISHSRMSHIFAEKYIKTLKTPEKISIFFPVMDKAMVNIPGEKGRHTANTRYVDDAYWSVFEFKFIEGAPFTKADFESGLPKAVISEQLAKELKGSTDNIVGSEIQLDFKSFTVVGVVKDVSKVAGDTYSDIWYPYSAKSNLPSDYEEGSLIPTGSATAALLAKNKKEFDKIRSEVKNMVERYNNDPENKFTINFMGAPDTFYTHTNRLFSNVGPDMKAKYKELIFKMLLLLIIPAINLSAMISSSINKRLTEQGIRRSYGATRKQIVGRVVSESFIQTLLGGILGFIFAVLGIYFFSELFIPNITITYVGSGRFGSIPFLNVVSLKSILFLLLFCFILNLTAALIPAVKYSNKPIVESLNIK